MWSWRLPKEDVKASAETSETGRQLSVFPSVGKAESRSRFYSVFILDVCALSYVLD